MMYVITGIGGHLGHAITQALLERGERVRGLLLPGQQPNFSGVEYIWGDVTQPESLLPLFRYDEEPVCLIHAAGMVDATGRMSRRLYDVNVGGTKNILALCRENMVDKLVYVSSVHAIPEHRQLTVQSEISQFDPALVEGGYAKAKAEATQAVLDAAAAGLPAVVVHPSGILGPYDDGQNHLVQLVRDFALGKLPACVKGGYDFVDVRDVAQGCILAAEHGVPGECYLFTGQYHEIREILGIAAGLVGRKKPVVLPTILARMGVPLLEFLAKRQKRRPLYTNYSLDTLRSLTRFSHQKASEALGYRTRDIQTTVRDTLRWLNLCPATNG